MALDVAAVQAALREEHLDAWLLYDFSGSNPIARRLVGLDGGRKMTTRRWYYVIPARGEPQGLVHAIEPATLDALPGRKYRYAGREQLESALTRLLASCRRVAMEFSPQGANPYLGRVDAGTVDGIRARGIEVVSSGDLVQRFEACWDAAALASHRAASERLYRIKDRTFAEIRDRLRQGASATEHQVQSLMVDWFGEEGLVSDAAPVVAFGAHSGDPHYMPPASGSARLEADTVVLIDLWGKLNSPGAVYADITWMAYTGPSVPDEVGAVFAAAARARDAAVDLVQTAARQGTGLRGWEVDRRAREVLEAAGYGPQILHRTGHSLGETVHGNGAHLDDYETHDDRRLLPGSGFTVEPGLYFDRFGVRTEINMVFGERDATVSGPVQNAVLTLA